MAKKGLVKHTLALWAWLTMVCAFSPFSDSRADELAARLHAATLHCNNIPSQEYETALIFNPPGMQTLYPRSVCFQELAVKLRDDSLCDSVKERKSLFFDGSGISGEKCRQLVQEQVSRDRTIGSQIKDIYRVAGVSFERNGNDKDVDVKIIASGSYRHTYNVTIALVSTPDKAERIVYRNDHFFGPGAEKLVLYIPQPVILSALMGRPLENPCRVRTRLTLVPSTEEVTAFSFIPVTAKESVYEASVSFGRLRRAAPSDGE
jgi:hypothetical protein